MPETPFHFEIAASLFEKADAPKGQTRRIGGVISTESPDRQGEVVLQQGLDFQPFLDGGWLNDNHSKATADGKLGYPVEVAHFQKGAKLPNGAAAQTNGHWMEGYLLDDWEPADKIWKLGKSLEKTGRSLGFSVEGQIHRRIGEKTVFKKSVDGKGGKWVGNTVAKATVANVAITDCPVNTDTSLELLAKSMADVEGEPMELVEASDVEARLEALEKALTMGPPSEKAPVGPKTGEGAGAVQAKESLEHDPKKDEETDEEKLKALKQDKKEDKVAKALSYDEATAFVRERHPQLAPSEAGRILAITQALKAQGLL